MSGKCIRKASHAGSWYTEDGNLLNRELETWLGRAETSLGPARVIIGPHAGYRYSGPTAAYAYKQIDPRGVKRVFVLGPSHRYRLSGCAVSDCGIYETPLYDLNIDTQINEELLSTKAFEVMSLKADEDEHSIEMHLPYLAKVMESRKDQFTVVPILVGSLSTDKEYKYGKIFAKYMMDPSNIFIISSDFCHWGERFSYTYYDKKCGDIHDSIRNLDKMGMDIIETLDHDAFAAYLRKYGNTICGRHPIGVFLGAVKAMRQAGNGVNTKIQFLKYEQSNKCHRMSDSSVSYASASFVIG